MEELLKVFRETVSKMVAQIEDMPQSYRDRLQKRADALGEAFSINWTTAEGKRLRALERAQQAESIIQALDDAIEGEVDTPEEVVVVREAMPDIVELAKDEKYKSRLTKILGAVGRFLFNPGEVR